MSEQAAGDVTEREEVAPGLVMEALHTQEPDGRALIYYNFHADQRRSVTLSRVWIASA